MNKKSDGSKKLTSFQKINKYIGVVVNGVEVSILVFCVASLGILLIANVFARTFFQSIYFAEEVSMFLVMLTTFTGVSYGVRKARHIRMGAFLDAMPPKL
jgi:TRAP-type C4-dicarboxylate transport system permease small subunit